ncbi:MAG: beta-ketoacyl-ACP synthase [Pseudomonadota bacterium]
MAHVNLQQASGPNPPVFVHQMTLTSALGAGMAATQRALQAGVSGLCGEPWPDCDVPCYLGVVDLPDMHIDAAYESRNNRLLEHALAQDDFVTTVKGSIEQHGAHRVGVVMGTSTSSIDRTEAAYRELHDDGMLAKQFLQPRVHNPHAPGDYLAQRLGITGPTLTVSAACASSAKVFAVAQRWLQQDLVDTVLVGGADTLCLSVIYGFHSLQLVSPEPCRPFAPDRTGISLGEAAGFALLSREPGAIQLLGVGESCDAHHMSSAHPEGLGARLSMQRALAAAGVGMDDVGYVNLHGTGTRANDDTEGQVCADFADGGTLFSATKGWTGHTLGAAGIVECVLAVNTLLSGLLPGTMNTREAQPGLSLELESREVDIRVAMSNSFGFGGNNCSALFGRT